MSRASFTNIVAVIAALLLGRCSADLPPPPVITQTFVDTVAPAALLAAIEDGALENAGLRAKLAGHVRVEPVYILRSDTVVTPPDTVLQLVAVNGATLTLAPLIVRDSADPLLRVPELHRFDVGACDDGWSWKSGELICDRARFGHLYATGAGSLYSPGGKISLAPEVVAGLRWKPSFRSPYYAAMSYDIAGRAAFTLGGEWAIW